MRYYYSIESMHGNETSRGFANDQFVLVWGSKKARDNYVNESRNMSTEPVQKKEITAKLDSSLGTPYTFSGEYWAIMKPTSIDDSIPGLIGEVGIHTISDHRAVITRLY